MFPNEILEDINTEVKTEEVGIDFSFDYKTGQHIMQNGLLVECDILQGVQQYIQNVLRTKANAFNVYTVDETDVFGISVYNYLNQRTLPMGYVNSELKREVMEQLLKHPIISDVREWKGVRERKGLHIYFNVVLTDGRVLSEDEVVGNV